MATVDECRTALQEVATRLSGDPSTGRKIDFDRSVACTIPDLKIAFHGRLREGVISGFTDGDDPKAQIRLTVGSDDLLALVAGTLKFSSAWSSGRLTLNASFSDLLKLRKLL